MEIHLALLGEILDSNTISQSIFRRRRILAKLYFAKRISKSLFPTLIFK